MVSKVTALVLGALLTGSVLTQVFVRDVASETIQDRGVPSAVVGLTVEVEAPKTSKIGELVVIDAAKTVADSFAWRAIPATPDFRVVNDGKLAFFSARAPGQHMFVIAAAKAGQVGLTIHNLQVDRGDDEPEPDEPDDPEPDEPDEPDDPDEPEPDELNALVAKWCKDVKSSTKRDDALAIAQAFRSAADLILEEMSAQEIVNLTSRLQQSALGLKLIRWKPLGAGLEKYLAAAKLETTDQHKKLWLKVADAIEKYAKGL